jgi:hypothetical protein
MNSTVNNADIIADIHGIITGTITSNTSLSASANASATLFYGTYPTGYYSSVNATAYAYTKKHSANSSANSYFQLVANSSNYITGLTLGKTYTASNNTFANSYSNNFTNAIGSGGYFNANSANLPIDIIVNDNMFLITQPSVGSTSLGVVDLAYDNMSATYTGQMINAMIDMNGSSITFTNPVMYKTQDQYYNYTSVSVSTFNGVIPNIKVPSSLSGNNVLVLENPLFLSAIENGYFTTLVYGLNIIQGGLFHNRAVYGNTSNYSYVCFVGSSYNLSIKIS